MESRKRKASENRGFAQYRLRDPHYRERVRAMNTPILRTFGLLLATFAATASIRAAEPKDHILTDEEKARISEALPEEAIVAPSEPRKVLIFSATGGYRHFSIPFGIYALEEMGMKTGAFEAVSDSSANALTPENLKKFDAVILLSSTGDWFASGKEPTEEEKALSLDRRQALIDYAKAGGGVIGIHAATDCGYDHAEFGEMTGGYFNSHPWTADKQVTIVVEEPDHAINRPAFDQPDFEVKDEIYQFKEVPYSRERLRILLTLDPARSDEPRMPPGREDGDYAVSWVHTFGEGRVFYSSLGHNPHIFWTPSILKHYLAGIQFAIGDLDADAKPSKP